MKNKLSMLLLSLVAGILVTNAQVDSEKKEKPLKISGYTEVFYSYDFNKPDNHTRLPFAYSYNRHNEVNLNIGLIKATYSAEKVRANLGLMTGVYAKDNLAMESGVMKNIYEANVGVKLSNTKNVWIDAGVMNSHIGAEGAIGADCMTLTRSIGADNSPYFETGVKLSYTTDDGKWMVAGLVLNGWQIIERPIANNTLGFGHQLTFTPNNNLTINSSSFVGNEFPIEEKRMRYFHDLYAILKLTDKVTLLTGFDLGAQQKSKGASEYNIWYAPTVIGQYHFTDKFSMSARVEYYCDQDEVIIKTASPNGFKTWGYSLNADYRINSNTMWRIEARNLSSKDKIFTRDLKPTDNSFFITSSLAVYF